MCNAFEANSDFVFSPSGACKDGKNFALPGLKFKLAGIDLIYQKM